MSIREKGIQPAEQIRQGAQRGNIVRAGRNALFLTRWNTCLIARNVKLDKMGNLKFKIASNSQKPYLNTLKIGFYFNGITFWDR